MTRKIGLLVGREWSFPPAFIEEVHRRDEDVVAEYVKLGGTKMDEPCEYDVIIDRISHEVPYYRTYLKQAVVQGATVVNNPFMWTADDKFFGAALATKLGIASPKTIALPNREYVPGIKHDESLRNLVFPMDWQGIVDYIGLPCVLKDAHGGGWKDVFVCHSMNELITHYNESGRLTMVVQEFIQWEHFVRCLVIGQEHVLPIKYDPKERKYHVEHEHMSAELGKRVVDDSLALMRALGYDMCSMEWAVKDGVPYAIDFMNPAPDMDVYSLTPHYFEWAVHRMADMAIRLAKEPKRPVDLRRGEFLLGRRFAGATVTETAAAESASLGLGFSTTDVAPTPAAEPTTAHGPVGGTRAEETRAEETRAVPEAPAAEALPEFVPQRAPDMAGLQGDLVGAAALIPSDRGEVAMPAPAGTKRATKTAAKKTPAAASEAAASKERPKTTRSKKK
jgi:hypothetical protein